MTRHPQLQWSWLLAWLYLVYDEEGVWAGERECTQSTVLRKHSDNTVGHTHTHTPPSVLWSEVNSCKHDRPRQNTSSTRREPWPGYLTVEESAGILARIPDCGGLRRDSG